MMTLNEILLLAPSALLKRRRLLPLCLLSCLLLPGCGGGDSSVTEAPVSENAGGLQAWPATRSTEQGGFTVTLEPEGGAIGHNRHFALDVSVQARDSQSGDVVVRVDADMPAHRHGMNTKPEVSPLGGSRFRVEGMLFHMIGDWVITVDVSRGSSTDRATFPVSVE